MAISFPSGPSDGQIFTENGVKYRYDLTDNSWRTVLTNFGGGGVTTNEAVDFSNEFAVNTDAIFVANGSKNVGVGTTTPVTELDVDGTITANGLTVESGDSLFLGGTLRIKDSGNTTQRGAIYGDASSLHINSGVNNLIAYSAGTERMRIDSSGNLLVGKTTTAIENVGMSILSTGRLIGTADGDDVLVLRRNTSDGDIISFRKDGTTVGSISSRAGSGIIINTSSSGTDGLLSQAGTECYGWGTAYFYPRADNTRDLGNSFLRWEDIYATNDTINTSDRNEKQDIEELSEAEHRVAVAAKSLMRKFRWKSAVEEKGEDARIHFGIIAQDLQAAFEAEGLDAGRYAMFISSTWWETQTEVPAVEAQDAVYETQTDDDGNEVQVLITEAVEAKEAYTRTDTYNTAEEAPEGATERTRLGVRYSELLAFIIAAI